ncbi:hypothetical protein Cni_G23018 [Canna indica]|uniref:RNase H type-1 domain-containing protein n=1 Tax=Canna indica TaxID=4628 RepID=A0AAQ3KSM2_9LILI|nr:hypothetical protein Cni_G23018 [Canna indica]
MAKCSNMYEEYSNKNIDKKMPAGGDKRKEWKNKKDGVQTSQVDELKMFCDATWNEKGTKVMEVYRSMVTDNPMLAKILLNKERKPPWYMKNMVADIEELAVELEVRELLHIRREGNEQAHLLANAGLRKKMEHVGSYILDKNETALRGRARGNLEKKVGESSKRFLYNEVHTNDHCAVAGLEGGNKIEYGKDACRLEWKHTSKELNKNAHEPVEKGFSIAKEGSLVLQKVKS